MEWGTACRIVFEGGCEGEGHLHRRLLLQALAARRRDVCSAQGVVLVGTEKMCVALGLPKKHYHCYQQPYYYLYVQDVRRRDPPSLLSST